MANESTRLSLSEYECRVQKISPGGPPYAGVCNKKTKKRSKSKKTCLEVPDRSKNLLSVQYRYKILCDNNRLSNQLLLSSEIGPFEVGLAKNPQNPLKSMEIHYDSTNDFTRKTW